MKKILLNIGVFCTVFAIMSVVTAVPQTNSAPAMTVIHEIEENRDLFEEKMAESSYIDPQLTGIIDLIRQLILMIINFVLNLIEIIRDLINLVGLIEYLIELVLVFIAAVFSLIEAIFDLFNPGINLA